MSISIISNDNLLAIAFQQYGNMRNDSVIRLFVNDFQPSSANVRTDFVEASFPGYALKLLNGVTGIPPRKITDGGYTWGFGPLTWNAGAGANQQVFGWYITGGSPGLWYSARFDTPIVMLPGTSFSNRAMLQSWNLQVGCSLA
jgi:hypothetical protein